MDSEPGEIFWCVPVVTVSSLTCLLCPKLFDRLSIGCQKVGNVLTLKWNGPMNAKIGIPNMEVHPTFGALRVQTLDLHYVGLPLLGAIRLSHQTQHGKMTL